MIPPRMIPLVLKQVARHRVRTSLTVLGIATAMFLFTAVRSVQAGVAEATTASAADSILIVYRESRFCPFTSRLPEDYAARIRRIPGVVSAIPVKVVVSNCRASLDVVNYRGVPAEEFARGPGRDLRLVQGSLADWTRRTDAALLGSALAARRGLRAGDRFDANGIVTTVAAVFESDRVQDRDLAFVHLAFLQRSPAVRKEGIVTQFEVRVDDPARLEQVSEAIDAEFHSAQEPTSTYPEKAFTARAVRDVMELLSFTRWVAAACVAAVLALVLNALLLSVQDRIRDFGILQTLGFTAPRIGGLVVAEALVQSLAGGLIGSLAAGAALHAGHWSLSNEGISIAFPSGPGVWLPGLAACGILGILAGIAPAFRAARVPIAETFRAV